MSSADPSSAMSAASEPSSPVDDTTPINNGTASTESSESPAPAPLPRNLLPYIGASLHTHPILPTLLTHHKLPTLLFILSTLLVLQCLVLYVIARVIVPIVVAVGVWGMCGIVLVMKMMWFYRCRAIEARSRHMRLVDAVGAMRDEDDAQQQGDHNDAMHQDNTPTTPLRRIASLMQRMSPSPRPPSRRIATRLSDDTDFADQWLSSLVSQRQSTISSQGRGATDPSTDQINAQLQHILTHLRLSMNEGNFSPEEYERLLRLDSFVSSPKGLSMHQIDRFPTFSVTMQSSALGERCNICMEDYVVDDKLMTLGCFHFFHETCIRQWLGAESKKCPVCMNNALVTEDGAAGGVDLMGAAGGGDDLEMDPIQMPFEYSGRSQHGGQTFVDL